MFGLLKDKLKSWIQKSKDKVKEIVTTPKEEKLEKKKEKKLSKKEKTKIQKENKKQKAVEKKAEKEIKNSSKEKEVKLKENTKLELTEERKLGGKILQDIQNEHLEIKTPEERVEDLIKEQNQEIEKPGFFKRLFTKSSFKITEEYFEEIFSELELVLLENNVAIEVVDKIKTDLKKELIGKEINKEELESQISSSLKNSISNILIEPFDFIKKVKEKEPFVILFFGINGSGKTTTIAKLAHLLKKNNLSTVLAAGDTFRAASIEQLSEHGRRLSTEVIKSQYGADPASVAFDAIKHAQAKKIKVVLIDTAGRMHTKDSLMKEMEKIVRVTKPDLKIFIAESITGNDAVEQAKIFNETIGIDGIILSKADVDEKGGTALSVSYVTGKPILFLGMGQNYEDLEVFNKTKVIKNLGL